MSAEQLGSKNKQQRIGLKEFVHNLGRAIFPDGEIIGYIRAPLYDNRLNDFKVFPPEATKKSEFWYAEDLVSVLYSMTEGFRMNPMTTIEVRRTESREEYFRPARMIDALGRAISLPLLKMVIEEHHSEKNKDD